MVNVVQDLDHARLVSVVLLQGKIFHLKKSYMLTILDGVVLGSTTVRRQIASINMGQLVTQI